MSLKKYASEITWYNTIYHGAYLYYNNYCLLRIKMTSVNIFYTKTSLNNCASSNNNIIII